MESPVTGKIGIGILTCDRPEMFQKCYSSIPPHAGIELVVVNDGVSKDHLKEINNLISHDEPYQGVAKTKNRALQYLLEAGCDHIFLIEDDMVIKRGDIFDAYINASKETGIQHLMFAYHGPANKNGISGGSPCPRLVIDYGNVSLALNQHCVGAFCYYSRECLEDVGLIDETFRNAFDHVSHSYTLALNGYSTPYWWWADLANSLDYIEEQACSEENSSIKTPERLKQWQENITTSMELFKAKFGVYPFGTAGVLDTSEIDIFKFLKGKMK